MRVVLAALLASLLPVLAGCAGPVAPDGPSTPVAQPEPAAPPEPPALVRGPDGTLASGGLHVLVVGGSVRAYDARTGNETWSFPEYVCDMALPRFSADDARRTLWYAPREGPAERPGDDPRDGDLAVLRLDAPLPEDSLCWIRSLEVHGNRGNLTWYHPDAPQTLPVRLEEGGVRVDGYLLVPGQELDWDIEVPCACPDGNGTTYRGTLHVAYLGDWGDAVLVENVLDLPPLDVPYGRPSPPQDASEASPLEPGSVPVLMLSGTVVESGPEYRLDGYCGVSAPSIHVDPERETIEYASGVPVEEEHDLFVVDRVYLEAMHDGGCQQLPRLQSGAGNASTPWGGLAAVRVGDHVRVGDVLLAYGDEAVVSVDWNVTEVRNGEQNTWRYGGRLYVSWPYAWPRGNITATL